MPSAWLYILQLNIHFIIPATITPSHARYIKTSYILKVFEFAASAVGYRKSLLFLEGGKEELEDERMKISLTLSLLKHAISGDS